MLKNKKGFTLVETIIYISLMSITLSNIIMFGTNISAIRRKTTMINNIQENNRLMINLINSTIRRSAKVILPAKGEISTSSLSIDMSGTDQATTTFSLVGTDLYLVIGSQTPVKLNHNVAVKEVSFLNAASQNDNDHIVATITCEGENSENEFNFQQTAETAITVRR